MTMAIDRSRLITSLLLIVVVVLIGQVYWQSRRITQMQASMEFQQRQFAEQVDKLAADKLKNRRGEVVQAEAWDGWCNYGTAENPNIKFVIPKEGSDLWTDTMVVLKSSKNKEAGMAFINFILDPKNQGWVAENILYKVPNQAAMDTPAVKDLNATYPNMGMTPTDLLQQEVVVDLGEDSVKYTDLATEVTSN